METVLVTLLRTTPASFA